jgi:aspartate carbamoyltransferase catalytic subunit
LRIQKERFKDSDSLNEANFINDFQVNDNFLSKTGFKGYLMHPGPMNIGAEITNEVADSDKSLILRQVENGLYLRTALLTLIA